MDFAKVSLLMLSLSCIVTYAERNNRIDVSSRVRIPYINHRNPIPLVSYGRAVSFKIPNEGRAIPGYLNSRTGRKSYSFDYKAEDLDGNAHYRREEADASGTVRGSYGYTDTEGLYRKVDYLADSSGFHVSIETNEPGVDGKKSPADVILMAREPPVGIQERYNEFRGGKPFGSVTGKYDLSKVEYPVPAVYQLATVVEKLYKSGINSAEPKEDNDEEPKDPKE